MKQRIELVIMFVLVLGFSLSTLASGFFELKGTVASFDSQWVSLSTPSGLVRIPRSTLEGKDVRPGVEVAAVVMAKTPMQVIDVPIKRELNSK